MSSRPRHSVGSTPRRVSSVRSSGLVSKLSALCNTTALGIDWNYRWNCRELGVRRFAGAKTGKGVGVTIRSAASWARMKGVVEERMEYVRWARAKGPKKMDGELGLAPNACRMRQVGCVALTLQCTSSQLDTHRFVL